MKLLIRNLARTTTETELQTMFESYGRVQSCSIILDKETGSSKGFGFVEMPMQGEAKAAMKAFNGKEVDGNKIRVKKAESKVVEEASDDNVKKPESLSTKRGSDSTSSKSIWKKRSGKT
jgi:RNA recognition motif-containing protein